MAKAAELNVTGLRELRTALRRLHPDLVPELRDGLKGAVNKSVLPDVKRRIRMDLTTPVKKPRRSKGRLADSVRTVSGGNRIYIVGGKAKVPYYGWRDFGGVLKPVGRRRNTQVRPFLKRGRYIYPAIDANVGPLADAAGDAFDRARRKAGL